METKHTPGPWTANASELEANSARVQIRGKNGSYIVCNDAGYQNARLIAAAPDLLESLRKLTEEIDPHETMTDPELSSHRPMIAARAAIAKATA